MVKSAVKLDTKGLDKYLKQLKGLPKLQSQALNEAARTVRTDTGRKIRQHTSAKAALVKKQFQSTGGGLVITKKASPTSLSTEIKGSKLTTEMSHKFFSVTQRKGTKKKPPRATIKLMGKRQVMRNSLLSGSKKIRARGRYSGDFMFEDDPFKPAPWVFLRTFSVRSQMNQSYITKSLDKVAFAAYEKALIRALKRKGLIKAGKL